jgi:hypothetical protein
VALRTNGTLHVKGSLIVGGNTNVLGKKMVRSLVLTFVSRFHGPPNFAADVGSSPFFHRAFV